MLAAEAAATGVIGATGVVGVACASPDSTGLRVVGVPLTAALSVVMLGVAVAATIAAMHRRAAKLFVAGMTAAAVTLMVICGVAAAHHDPGPLGFTTPAILLWAVVFCYDLGVGWWLLPDEIEGPRWLPRGGSRRHATTAASASGPDKP